MSVNESVCGHDHVLKAREWRTQSEYLMSISDQYKLDHCKINVG